MNTPRLPKLSFLALLGASLLLSNNVFADAAARAKLVAERDAILVAFVQEAESQHQAGTGNEEQVAQVTRALYSFRRDNATRQEDRISNQELIIQILQKQLLKEKTRHEAGLGTQLTLLKAKDELLDAQILLEDLRAGVSRR